MIFKINKLACDLDSDFGLLSLNPFINCWNQFPNMTEDEQPDNAQGDSS